MAADYFTETPCPPRLPRGLSALRAWPCTNVCYSACGT